MLTPSRMSGRAAGGSAPAPPPRTIHRDGRTGRVPARRAPRRSSCLRHPIARRCQKIEGIRRRGQDGQPRSGRDRREARVRAAGEGLPATGLVTAVREHHHGQRAGRGAGDGDEHPEVQHQIAVTCEVQDPAWADGEGQPERHRSAEAHRVRRVVRGVRRADVAPGPARRAQAAHDDGLGPDALRDRGGDLATLHRDSPRRAARVASITTGRRWSSAWRKTEGSRRNPSGESTRCHGVPIASSTGHVTRPL